MKPWRVCYLLLVCLVVAGCQSTARDRNRELLEREMRWQEDEIFQLEDELEDARRKLDSCRRENEALRKQLTGRSGGEAPASVSLPSVDLGVPGEPTTPTYEPPQDMQEAPVLEAPPYDLPWRSNESGGRDDESGDDEPGPIGLVSYQQDPDFVETDYHIAKIALNRRLTGAYDRDGRPGSDGVLVMVEPLNAAGRIINVPAQISIAVVDPALYGEAGRVARWDFSADEAADRFRQTPMGRGMEFRLPWPNQPPESRELQLHVRCITTDGIELRTKRDFQVALPGAPDSGWTTAATPRAPAPAAQQSRQRVSAAVAKLETVPIEPPRQARSAVPTDSKTPRSRTEPVRLATAEWPDDGSAESEVEEGPVASATATETQPEPIEPISKPSPPQRASWSPYR